MANNIVITSTAGGGSINIQKDDSIIASAISVINFEGTPVVVTDEGSGKVTVTLVDSTQQPNLLYRHNGTTTQTITATFSIVVFPTSVRQDSDYLYSSGAFTFQRAGWYRVSYDVGIDNPSSSTRTNSESAAFLNGVEISGTKSWAYHRTSANGQDNTSATFLIQVSLNDVLTIRSREENGATLQTLANSCRINIERIS